MSPLTPWPAIDTRPNALRAASASWATAGVLTTRSPWAAAGSLIERAPATVVFVETNTHQALDRCAAQLKGLPVVVGIGGGLVMDAAKYVAKRNGQTLVQVPSTASNNACFTRTAWTISAGQRQPVRDCPVPEAIVVDPALIAAAPAAMNRTGLAEILCSHTAIFDWQLARKAGRDVDWNDQVLSFTQAELAALPALARRLAHDDVAAFIAIIECCARFAPHFTSHPRARFNACSEHLFAWSLEQCAGRHVLHGDAVSLGILIMSHVQGNAPDLAADIIEAARLPSHPEDLGLDWSTVASALGMVPDRARAMQWYSIVDELEPRHDPKRALLDRLPAAAAFLDGRRRHRAK